MNVSIARVDMASSLQAPSLSRLFLLEAGYECLRVWRTPAFSLPTLLFPMAFYAVFALVLPGQWGGLHKPTYLLATYGVFGVMGPALFGFGAGLAMERQQGWLELKRVSPMPIAAYLVAKLTMALLFAAIVVLELSVLAAAFGGVTLSASSWLALIAVLLLAALPFCALGLWIGTLVKGQAAVAVVNLVYMPMAMLSGLWMPLWVFPVLLQKLAVVWPAWHAGQLALAVVGQAQDLPWAQHVAALLLMGGLFLGLAIRRWRGLQAAA